MSIVSNTRVDIVARGVIKACLELGFDPAEKIAVFRIPGAWEEEGFKILEKYGVEYFDRSVSMHEAAKRAVEKIDGGGDGNGAGPAIAEAPGLEERTSGEVTEAP
jgi:succinyl-CoA synthetase beta subunit/citryl-CoA synthetase large subunit